MNDTDEMLPAPDLEARRINVDQYYAYAPEKFELDRRLPVLRTRPT